MGEFELIRRYFFPLANSGRHPDIVLGPGDDCAIQQVREGVDLVFSVDTLVEGVHFPEHYSPARLAWRSLAVAASDLAAMGADPVCFTLAITLPEASPGWLQDFSTGLAAASRQFGLSLAGGDTTRGPLTLTLQVHGTVPRGGEIRRSGARPDDLICVSGTLGNAGAALEFLDEELPTLAQAELLSHYHAPQPRIALGQALRGRASAAVDISDGLAADLGHLLEASGVGGIIDVDCLPLSDALVALRPDAIDLALYAGDDYQLCITLPGSSYEALEDPVRAQLTVIGRVVTGKGLSVDGAGKRGLNRPDQGYDHFRSG
jgi:thiamine-monophosphate kinase